MSLKTRVRQLARLIGNARLEPEPMWTRLMEALPDCQLIALHEAFEEPLGEGKERLGADGERLGGLFLFVVRELEDGVKVRGPGGISLDGGDAAGSPEPGVAPRTARAALRHSTLDLTMNTYTDPQLLDVARARCELANAITGAARRSRWYGARNPHARMKAAGFIGAHVVSTGLLRHEGFRQRGLTLSDLDVGTIRAFTQP